MDFHRVWQQQRFGIALFLAFVIMLAEGAVQGGKGYPGEQALPPIYFNHASIVVSREVYEAINHSTFVSTEFSYGGERTVTGAYSATASYTNILVLGKNTYLEIKNANSLDEQDQKRNTILFIMSIDDRSQLPAVSQSFEREHIQASIYTAMRTFDGHEVKWHDATGTSKWSDNPDPAHTPWFAVAAIYPGYLKAAYPDLKEGEDGTTREKYNARRYRADLLLQDITAFDIDIGSDQIPILVAQFKAMGYTLSTAGKITTVSSPDVAFYLRTVDSESPRSIAVHFSLNRAKEGQQVYSFQNSELRFQSDRTAIWTFPGAWRKNN